ncbi:MAG: S9 family peptidase [Sphingobacteriales bacterium]|nr:MAG: S9 family peptidase [Sphingobacteriales bacterium]TAF82721.1 MAG: S9 family peptidase [Sphingobacteriales bacterium]
MTRAIKLPGLFLLIFLYANCNMPGQQSIPTAYFFTQNNVSDYRISPDGVFVSYVKRKNEVTNIFVKNIVSGYSAQITYLKIGNIKSYYWANDNTIFYISSKPDGESLYYVNTKGRGNYKTLNANSISFIDSKLWYNKFILLSLKKHGEQTKQAYSVNIATWKPTLIAGYKGSYKQFLNANNADIIKAIKKCLNPSYFDIIDNDAKNNFYILKTYSDRQKDAFYLYNKTKNTCDLLSDNEAITPSNLCETKPVQFSKTSGKAVYGFLTLPKSGTINLPTVIIPYANSNSKNNLGFVPEVQFLAHKGYAVLQIKSTLNVGYSNEAKKNDLKKWVFAMQADIIVATKWLIKKQIANPSNIGIYGTGFGGFIALNAAYQKPQIFKCAAAYSGINNLFTYLKEHNTASIYQYLLYNTKKKSLNEASFIRNFSPVFNTDKINIPLFIAQGGKDNLISVNETNDFVKILRKRNIKIKYLVKDEEGHTFKNKENIIELYNNLDNFFKQNLN